jgi:RNA polymerase sigma factor (sigma-70 family)
MREYVRTHTPKEKKPNTGGMLAIDKDGNTFDSAGNPVKTYSWPVVCKIQKLDNRLRLIASSYANDPMEADDCYSYVMEKLAEQVKLEDKDARILMIARSRAADWRNRENAYAFRVASESDLLSNEDTADDYFEFQDENELSVEEQIMQREQADIVRRVLSGMTPENREVISMVILGYKQSEIAVNLNVTEAAISLRIKRIKNNCPELRLSLSVS